MKRMKKKRKRKPICLKGEFYGLAHMKTMARAQKVLFSLSCFVKHKWFRMNRPQFAQAK